MHIPRIPVNLDRPPEERWNALSDHQSAMDELVSFYLNDISVLGEFDELIDYFRTTVVPLQYVQEISGIARLTRYTENQVFLANAYYDALKFGFACTAFSSKNKAGQTLHARNLDWWSENDGLSRHSSIFDFQRGGQTIYTAVGWFGFSGILSGVSRKGFAITLNAVWSTDPPNVAIPITYLIRQVLEEANDFDEARERLASTDIASDCLLLLSGTGGRMCVIERSPSKAAIRECDPHGIVVTNDYRMLSVGESAHGALALSSCARYDRADILLKQQAPKSADECFDILSDRDVQMDITAQQMVFNCDTGEVTFRYPEGKVRNAPEMLML